jgi:hypothetical protein
MTVEGKERREQVLEDDVAPRGGFLKKFFESPFGFHLVVGGGYVPAHHVHADGVEGQRVGPESLPPAARLVVTDIK